MRGMSARSDFRLYHGNDLDMLAGVLAAELAQPLPGVSVLAPETVLIPQVAMKRWLQQALAARHGVAANLRFLTPGEFDMLLSLARAKGRVKTRDALLSEVRDREWQVFDRAIDVQISNLRKKLGDDPKEPRFIRTIRSAGYMLVDPNAPPA